MIIAKVTSGLILISFSPALTLTFNSASLCLAIQLLQTVSNGFESAVESILMQTSVKLTISTCRAESMKWDTQQPCRPSRHAKTRTHGCKCTIWDRTLTLGNDPFGFVSLMCFLKHY